MFRVHSLIEADDIVTTTGKVDTVVQTDREERNETENDDGNRNQISRSYVRRGSSMSG